jgi:hypothetical protein
MDQPIRLQDEQCASSRPNENSAQLLGISRDRRNFGSNQVAPVWAIPGFLIDLLDFKDGSESHPYLDVVVHREFVRMGSQTQSIVFFLFHVDPVGDEIFVEDVAA